MSAEEHTVSADAEAAELQEAPEDSRSPRFDMTYQPEECVFPPHWLTRAPSFVYLFAAVCVAAVVILGENSSSTSKLFQFVVAEDNNRMIGMRTLAIVLAVGSVASVIRGGMRGVRILPDGVETRDIHNLFVPRVRRYRWLQMECIVLDMKRTVALDLWDGSRAFLPAVANPGQLRATLERVAAARAIPVRGGQGLSDVPEPISGAPDARG